MSLSDRPTPPIFRYRTWPSTDRAVRAFPWQSRDHAGRPRQGRSCIDARYRGGISGAPFTSTALVTFTCHDLRLLAPARGLQSRESCLRVCRYVASIRLSLGFHGPIPIGQNEHLGNNPLARPSHGTTRASYVHQNFSGQMVPMGSEGAKSTEKFWCTPDGGSFLWP